MDSFSKRHSLKRADAEITIRLEAPEEIRDAVIEVAYRCGLKPSDLRRIICRMLYRSPDANNWSEYPNVDAEVRGLIQDCEWFEVYDLIEVIAHQNPNSEPDFADEINLMFRFKGVGWQVQGSQLEMRGSEAFEIAVKEGHALLLERGNVTAANELHEAITDLSRRPDPEISGAIQHAMACAGWPPSAIPILEHRLHWKKRACSRRQLSWPA